MERTGSWPRRGRRAIEERRIALKPGLFLMVAEEEPPAWVETVQHALDASGLEVKAARGYRAFYEEQKAANPNWSGVQIATDQDFALIIGPDPG